MATYQSYGQGGFNTYGNPSTGFEEPQSTEPRLQPKNSITPVTIKQIHAVSQPLQDAGFFFHNMEIAAVSFIGVVRNAVDVSNAISYTIEDGTGSIEVREWYDEGAGAKEPFPTNIYVHVSGSLKLFNGKKSVQNPRIRKVEDHNEVVYHNLYAIAAYLRSKNPNKQVKMNSNGDLFVSEPASEEGLPKDRIMKYIATMTPSMAEGVPASLIARSLKLNENEVEAHIRDLCDAGKVYSGFDDNGYLAV
ncbi:unnamed protein product [Kuraishia capsulata CBS 1993]|uniref:Replication protein A C-terminal domain-containing protein n=1 Tax=Kuraishia capsulata CBS 1993 TaxID=1382522 RepID=W6MG10_9ASCO|nr:uncharacterized protein KUCA_T00000592001 [Kuraishia capsulata CBS 1993]CDK24626.1 unnamed protein product [Kuraishia capsulata CBS 1993]